MAGAAATKTEWGYYITNTGTDATSVWTDGRKYVRAIVFAPGTTNDTCTITTTRNIKGAATSFLTLTSAGTAGVVQCPWTFDEGVPCDNLAVSFNNTSSKLWIIMR